MAELRSGQPEADKPAHVPAVAAIIGCGVIGAAWAARLRLHGVTVRAFDPSPEAGRLLAEVQENANLAWNQLGLTEALGGLELCGSIEEAVEGAELIQESVPEVLEIKVKTLTAIDAAANPTAVIGSSTSGLLCTDMARSLRHPQRMVVAHPFNPVYLLPLVEIVGGEQTSPSMIEQACTLYRGISMKPLVVRAEIDAHIADRLLEAVWRESLWLINDGVATTEEIDDAIRYGFGLRWAQMGLFETYRVAGGEGGFAHFLKQFGPTLSWPWTKLMDVPDFTDELVGQIVEQSDAQSGQYSVRQLERIRDKNIAAMLRALEGNEWGAGQLLGQMRDRYGSGETSAG